MGELRRRAGRGWAPIGEGKYLGGWLACVDERVTGAARMRGACCVPSCRGDRSIKDTVFEGEVH